MSRKAGVGYRDTDEIPDFERKMLVGFLYRDLKKEEEQIRENTRKMRK